MVSGYNLIAAALAVAGSTVQALPTTVAGPTTLAAAAAAAASTSATTATPSDFNFQEDWANGLNIQTWMCQGSCPGVQPNNAQFTLKPAGGANQTITVLQNQLFTWGIFNITMRLSAQPKARVFWGASLYADGPAGQENKYDQIDFGFYTNSDKYGNTMVMLEAAHLAQRTTIQNPTSVDLYDGNAHFFQLDFSNDEGNILLMVDGNVAAQITDKNFIPTQAMGFNVGTRLVDASNGFLTEEFTQTVESVSISGGSSA